MVLFFKKSGIWRESRWWGCQIWEPEVEGLQRKNWGIGERNCGGCERCCRSGMINDLSLWMFRNIKIEKTHQNRRSLQSRDRKHWENSNWDCRRNSKSLVKGSHSFPTPFPILYCKSSSLPWVRGFFYGLLSFWSSNSKWWSKGLRCIYVFSKTKNSFFLIIAT